MKQDEQTAAEEALKMARTKPSPPQQKITATPHVWRDPKSIRPRDFLYGDCVIRGYVSGIISMGGVGKTSEIMVEIAAMVTGRGLLGVKPKRPYRVWYMNLEDPQEEIDRRFAAIFKHYNITEADIGGRLFTDSGRGKNFVVAKEGRGGIEFNDKLIAHIEDTVRESKIDFIVIDPFVNCARFAENDNNMMAAIIERVWAGIAERQNCAGGLVHHVRKGSGSTSYTVEDARGAGALINSCRNVRVCNTMTKDEGKRAGIERWRSYFRIDNGKANLAPPSEESEWRKIVSVDLGNAMNDCPADHIGVVTPWMWPDPLANLTDEDLLAAQKAVNEGGPWRKDSQAKKDWVGKPIAKALKLDLDSDIDRAALKDALKLWIEKKYFREVEGEDKHRNKRWFVEVSVWINASKPTSTKTKPKAKSAQPKSTIPKSTIPKSTIPKPKPKSTTKSADLPHGDGMAPYSGPTVDVPNLGPDPLDQHGKPKASKPAPLTADHARELLVRSKDWIEARYAKGLDITTDLLEAELRTVLGKELPAEEVEAAVQQVVTLVVNSGP